MLRLIVAMAASMLVFAGCSSSIAEFSFTPVPYTQLPERGCPNVACSDVYSLTEECGWEAADQVSVVVEQERAADLIDLAEDAGFDELNRYESEAVETTHVLLEVPAGSVPNAIDFIEEHAKGIVAIDSNGTAWIPESVPQFIQDCQKTKTARDGG